MKMIRNIWILKNDKLLLKEMIGNKNNDSSMFVCEIPIYLMIIGLDFYFWIIIFKY